MRQRWMLTGMAMVAVSFFGCTASETSEGSDPTVTATSGDGGGSAGCTPAEGGTDLESVLHLVPDTNTNRQLVQVADLEAFLADQGKTLPEDFSEIRFVDPVSLFTPTPLLQDALAQADESTDPMADELGIGLGQVRVGVSAGLAPDVTEVLVGDFDPAAVEAAVAADPFWSSRKETVEANGQTYHSWGGDNETQIEGRTPMRRLGIGGRLWVGDHAAAFTRSTGVMEEVLAGCAGEGPTLADDDVYAGIAQRLDGFEGAFDAVITNQVRLAGDVSPSGRGSSTSTPDLAGALDGVTAYGFATGPSDDPDQARLVLVLASETDEQANTNIQRFLDRATNGTSARTGELWADSIDVESWDIDGRFVTFELRSENSSVLRSDLMAEDTLIVSE